MPIFNCHKCGIRIEEGSNRNRVKYCIDCRPNFVDWSQVTLGGLVAEFGRVGASAKIRDHSRRQYIHHSDRPKNCENCGYNKHYQVCHIKGVKDFHPDTPISVINDINNLVALCPNCHYEMDNNLLDKDCRLFTQGIIRPDHCGTTSYVYKKTKCAYCGKVIEITQQRAKFCSQKCCGAAKELKNIPTKEQLIEDYKNINKLTLIGNKYNTSYAVVRKWMDRYGIKYERQWYKTPIKNCEVCNKEFRSCVQTRKYCSVECYRIYQRREGNMEP